MELRLCKNERCNNLVLPSKNPGVIRKYCHRRCATAVASRNYYYRICGNSGDGMLKEQDGVIFLTRVIAPTMQAAQTRYRNHLVNCAQSGGEQCIARRDPYDHKRECLIHAVLREDWDYLRRKARREPWEREVTTDNGFWKPRESEK